jgi:hypothetical protein
MLLPKVNNHQWGEISPNLVTLRQADSWIFLTILMI